LHHGLRAYQAVGIKSSDTIILLQVKKLIMCSNGGTIAKKKKTSSFCPQATN